MKRRRLTIILFSVMMVAAAPRAMSHFNSYTDALHHQVETEWLSFLLSFGTPAENDAAKSNQKSQPQPTPCTAHEDSAVQPSASRSRSDAAPNSRKQKARARSFEFAFTELPSTPIEFEQGMAAEFLRYNLEERRHQFLTPAPPESPAAAPRKRFAKANNTGTEPQGTRLSEKRAARALARELANIKIEKLVPALVQRVRFEQAGDQAPDTVPVSVDRVSPERDVVPENTMR